MILLWPSVATGQSAVIHVDIKVGVDATGNGGIFNPYKTISFALSDISTSATSPKTLLVRARTDASNNPIPHSVANGESFPITLKPFSRVARAADGSPGSEAGIPLVISGAGSPRVATLIVIDATNGEIFNSLSGLANLTLEEASVAGVQMTASSLTAASEASPAFLNVTFNQCAIGMDVKIGPRSFLHSTTSYPTLSECTFTVQSSLSGAPAQPVTTHFRQEATNLGGGGPVGQSLTAGGSITGCTFTTEGPYSVTRGLDLRAVSGGNVRTVVSSSTVDGNANAATGNGIATGVYLYYYNGNSSVNMGNSASFMNTKVRECGVNGFEVYGKPMPLGDPSNYLGNGGGPTISHCAVVGNGTFSTGSPNEWEGHGVSVRVGNRVRMYPKIVDNTNVAPPGGPVMPDAPQIADNARDGVFLYSEGNGQPGAGIPARPQAGTQVAAGVRRNRIQGNGRDGVSVRSVQGSARCYIEANEIYDNDRTGFRSFVEGSDSPLDSTDIAASRCDVWNNTIFDLPSTTNAVQDTGAYNEVNNPGGLYFDEKSYLVFAFNTVAYNDQYGIRNVGPFNNSETEVYATIFYRNANSMGAGDVIDAEFNGGANPQIQYCMLTGSHPVFGATNRAADAQFVDGANADFHVTDNSLAIDWVPDFPTVFSPSTDFDGQSRTFDHLAHNNGGGRTNDIGADEDRH